MAAPQNMEGVEDDVVQYYLFTTKPASSFEDQLHTYLAYLSCKYDINKYIWQRDPFRLQFVGTTASVPAHLYGSSSYGDNVEDEWFIVFLLIELTKEFPELVVRVEDNDGEFLLIEAANHLPKWLDPSSAENRVFLHRGQVHIIPRSQTSAATNQVDSQIISTVDAINFIATKPNLSLAPRKIQEDIHNRIAEYPEKAAELVHRTHCYLPASLAAILETRPALIASIVDAFYHRDVLDLKACVTFKHFRPGTRVMRQISFTRCLYAQLLKQKFLPDRRSGFTLPPPTNSKYKAHDLGMKLAHGAEILCSKYDVDDVNLASNLDVALKSDTRWHRFVEALSQKGYFKQELEGSKLYMKLMDEAKNYYISSVKFDESGSDAGKIILDIMKSINVDIEMMRRQEKDLPPEDDDGWLDIGPEQLDSMLNKLMGKDGKMDGFDLEKVTDKMKSFVDKVSSHEGAEFPKASGDDDDVQFDPNSFMQSMQKIFEFHDPESSSSSEMDEYDSEDDLDDSCVKKKNKVKSKSKPLRSKKANDIAEYMDVMDRELAHTTIGQSFVREGDNILDNSMDSPKPPPRKKKQSKPQTTDPTQKTKTGGGPAPSRIPKQKSDDIDDEDDDFRPVNVDLNMVKNLMESYNSQQGTAGPTSNILGSMGMRLPRDADDF